MKQRAPVPKPAPIQQFIAQLKERESIRSPEAAKLPVEGFTAASAGTQASGIQPESLMEQPFVPPVSEIPPSLSNRLIPLAELEMRIAHEGDPIPAHWSKGALLNVRNRGDHYCVTLYPEEFDPRHPERAMTFPNTWECQDFVSKWYARETADPRAR